MKKLTPYLLYTTVGAGVIADHWYGITEAGNIAIAAIWLLVLLTLTACVFYDAKDLKNANTTKIGKYVLRWLLVSNVVILFTAGWFITGFALLVAWLAMCTKTIDKST